MRIFEGMTLGQLRTNAYVDQFAVEEQLRKAGLRPDLFPTDTTPMSLVTPPNPGEAVLLKRGDILPLTPAGSAEVLVYPKVNPASDLIQDMRYEDRFPRDQHRAILRSSNDVLPDNLGPFALYPGMGQPESDETDFIYSRYSDAGYQTYPGPFLGQASSPGVASWILPLGAIALGLLLSRIT